MSFRHQIGRLCAVPCALAVLTGCAGQATSRPDPIAHAGHQATSWDAVLPSPRLAAAEPGFEHSRRDDALNIRDLQQAAAEPGPSLDHPRRLRVRPRPDEVIFFRRGRHHRPWW